MKHRRFWGVLFGSTGLAFVVLVAPAWIVPHLVGPDAIELERAVLQWFQGLSGPGVDLALREASQLTEGIVLALLVLVVAAFLWKKVRPLSWIVLFVYPASAVLHWGGKLLVDRPRPRLTDWSEHLASGSSYASGHAISGLAVFVILSYAITRVDTRVSPTLVWLLCGTVILVSGVTRLYLGVHWPTDVIGGWISGLVLAGGCIQAHRILLRGRPSVSQRRARETETGRESRQAPKDPNVILVP